MDNLKPCGCGATPETLFISDGSTFRWRYISGSCCGVWEHECRVPTIGDNATPEGVKAACVKAWNDLPRPTADRIADLQAQLAAHAEVVEAAQMAISSWDGTTIYTGQNGAKYRFIKAERFDDLRRRLTALAKTGGAGDDDEDEDEDDCMLYLPPEPELKGSEK